MKSPEPVTIEVGWTADVRMAADRARGFASSLGFAATECEEIALVVTELASNLVRHAFRGTIGLSAIDTGGHLGIQIESKDRGPGISETERAITDGYSTAGGPGLGLGTVNRLMDVLHITSGVGLHVVSQRWRRTQTTFQPQELVFGVATRAFGLMPHNGDAFVIKQWHRYALAGVIDGLGHGELAQRASRVARQYVEQHFDQPLENIFCGAARACRATRGVVMALARFDLERHKFTIANIGNIEVKLLGGSEPFNPVVRRGIIGLNAPNPVCTDHAWNSKCVLIMHSDGLRAPPHWRESADFTYEPPSLVAQRLLNEFAKKEDDATVIVARNAHA